MGSLSTLVPHRERRWVVAIADQLRREAGATWAAQPPELARRVCFAVAAIAPRLPYDRLSLLARYASWAIVLDDQLDTVPADPAALDQLQRAITAVTVGGRPDPTEPVPAQLAGILAGLAGYDRVGTAVDRFAGALREAVAAGVAHALRGQAVARGEQPPPTAEEYLPTAARSVNYRSFGYALLALVSGSPTGPELASIDTALWHAAYAVRLANDLRGAVADHAAARLNMRCLHTASGSPVTSRYLRQAIDRRVLAHERALHPPGGRDPVPAAAVLTRSLRLSVRIYRLADLRPS